MKRKDILDAALAEFSTHDYHRASINSIIERSNTSKGTFYHYFAGKEALYLELIKLASQEKLKYMKATDRTLDTTNDVSVFEMMKKQMEGAFRFGMAHPKLAKFAVMVANETNGRIREAAQSVVGSSVSDYLEQMIDREIASGRIRDDVPKEFILEIFGYMMTHFNDFMAHGDITISPTNEETIKKYIGYYLDFMEHGLGTAKNQWYKP